MLVDVSGPGHPDQVWQRFSTPQRWPEWAPQIRAVTSDDTVLRPGATGRVHGPGPLAVDYEVVEVDAGLRTWTWRAGRGPSRLLMRHHVLPAPGGGSHALLQVEGAAAVLGQPYRLVAAAALRRLVAVPSPEAVLDQAAPTEAVAEFDFAFSPAHAAAALPFGITRATSGVEVGPSWLLVRYGPWRLLTPRSNVTSAQVTGDFSFVKTAGPPHLSMTDRGVSFTSNGERALCVEFAEPVTGIDTTGSLRHPGATLAVADPKGLAAALGFDA